MSKALTPDPGTLATDVVPNFEQRVELLTGEQRAHWELTGELPQNSDAVDSTDTSVPSTDISEGSGEPESGAAPDPAIDEQPPSKEVLTPQQQSERKRRNDANRLIRLNREAAEWKAKYELLAGQKAEKAESAPATQPKEPEVPKERPKRPRFSDYTDGNLYDAAMDKYETDIDLWNGRVVEDRVSGVRQESLQTSEREKRDARIAAARERYTDFDKVAFSDVPVSWGVAELIHSLENGADLQYLLGKTPAEAERILKLTVFPGEDKFQTIGEFQKWIKADPDRAMLYGEKRAIAKAELAKLGKSINPAAQHRTPSRTRPTSEVAVEARGAPAIDGLDDAIKRDDFEAYERLANQRDVAERTGRR